MPQGKLTTFLWPSLWRGTGIDYPLPSLPRAKYWVDDDDVTSHKENN